MLGSSVDSNRHWQVRASESTGGNLRARPVKPVRFKADDALVFFFFIFTERRSKVDLTR